MGTQEPPVWHEYMAEIIGTAILIIVGDFPIALDVTTGALGLGWVAFLWGMAVIMAIYVAGGVSGAHINPAVTVSLALTGRFPWKKVLPYIIFQIIGAFFGALTTYLVWWSPIEHIAKQKAVMQGAFIFFCFYPHPAFWPQYVPSGAPYNGEGSMAHLLDAHWPWWYGFLAEIIMTSLLLLVVVAVTDDESPLGLGKFAGIVIGLYVFAAVAIEAPITMTDMNPARDWGPRLFALLAGWPPEVTIPGWRFPWNFPLTFGIAQFIGGYIGVLVWDYLLKPYFKYIKGQ